MSCDRSHLFQWHSLYVPLATLAGRIKHCQLATLANGGKITGLQSFVSTSRVELVSPRQPYITKLIFFLFFFLWINWCWQARSSSWSSWAGDVIPIELCCRGKVSMINFFFFTFVFIDGRWQPKELKASRPKWWHMCRPRPPNVPVVSRSRIFRIFLRSRFVSGRKKSADATRRNQFLLTQSGAFLVQQLHFIFNFMLDAAKKRWHP